MCRKIVINKGEKDIETPLQFKEYFGFYPTMNYCFNEPDLVCCLCPVNIKEVLESNNIAYKMCGGDYYVGQLESVN